MFQPSIEALVAFKDRLRIPDEDWGYVVEVMRLGPKCTLHYVKEARHGLSNDVTPTKVNTVQCMVVNKIPQTAGGRGSVMKIKKMIQYLLEQNPPKDPSKPVQIKFALDGGTMTSGKRIKQEQGTLQIITGYSLQELKSHHRAHQWLIYLGEEEYDVLEEELQQSIPEIMEVLDTKVPNTNQNKTNTVVDGSKRDRVRYTRVSNYRHEVFSAATRAL